MQAGPPRRRPRGQRRCHVIVLPCSRAPGLLAGRADAMAFALGAPAERATAAPQLRRTTTRCSASSAAPARAALSARTAVSSRAGLHAPQRLRRSSVTSAARADIYGDSQDGMYVDLCPGFSFFKARTAMSCALAARQRTHASVIGRASITTLACGALRRPPALTRAGGARWRPSCVRGACRA